MLAAVQLGKCKEGETHSLSSGGLSEEHCHRGVLPLNAGLEQALVRSTEGMKATLLTTEKNSSFKLLHTSTNMTVLDGEEVGLGWGSQKRSLQPL